MRSIDDHTVRSGDDATVRSQYEETANLLSGRGSSSHYSNPYRKKQQGVMKTTNKGRGTNTTRVSFAEQLFGKTYDSNSSVAGSMVGSISGSVSSGSGVRRKVPRLSNQSNGAAASSNDGVLSLSNVMTQRLLRITHLKKNATLLSIMALGMMIFIGGAINLSESIVEDVVMKEESRGLGYDIENNAHEKRSSVPEVSGGGIMDNYHPHTQAKTPVDGKDSSEQTIDWNKVPPHLRGYYSKTFGQIPSDSSVSQNTISYRKEQDDYEHTQFSNREQAKAIQSIGQEAVLGYRPQNGRDYHAQGELNKELTSSSSGGTMGFSGPMLGKDAFDSQEEELSGVSQLGGGGLRGVELQQQQQQQQVPIQSQVIDSEEQKRLAAQEAALAKTSTAEDDARKKRLDELAQLRASAGLTGDYYSKQQSASAALGIESGQNLESQQLAEDPQQQAAAEQRMKEDAEAAQKKAEESQQVAAPPVAISPKDSEADAMAKMKEEIRQRNEEAARQQEEKKKREEEKRQREEAAAREQEVARQQAAEKAARLKLEYAQEQLEEEKLKHGSMAQQLMAKYAHVPFKEQIKSPPAEKKPKPSVPMASSQEQQPAQQQQVPAQAEPVQEQPSQNLPDLSEWRNDVNSKFVERLKADEKVDHTAPKPQPQAQPQSSHQVSLLTEKPRVQEKPAEETNYRLQIANGELPFDVWRAKMKEKLHSQIMAERAKNAPPEPSAAEVKEMVSQKMEEVEQAQNAVMTGQSSDLESISSLQKELSELLSLMGGGR